MKVKTWITSWSPNKFRLWKKQPKIIIISIGVEVFAKKTGVLCIWRFCTLLESKDVPSFFVWSRIDDFFNLVFDIITIIYYLQTTRCSKITRVSDDHRSRWLWLSLFPILLILVRRNLICCVYNLDDYILLPCHVNRGSFLWQCQRGHIVFGCSYYCKLAGNFQAFGTDTKRTRAHKQDPAAMSAVTGTQIKDVHRVQAWLTSWSHWVGELLHL